MPYHTDRVQICVVINGDCWSERKNHVISVRPLSYYYYYKDLGGTGWGEGVTKGDGRGGSGGGLGGGISEHRDQGTGHPVLARADTHAP